MKKISFFLFLGIMISYSAFSDEQFCKNTGNPRPEKFSDFNNSFCFATKEFMKKFALELYDNQIPFVVYSNGYIGYLKKDKDRVQVIGDKLTYEHLSNRKK